MFDESYILDTETLLEKAKNVSKLGFDPKELKEKIKSRTITSSNVKSALMRVVAHSPETLAGEVPSLLDAITNIIIVGIPFYINPILGIPAIIATKVIRNCADAKVIGSYISSYNLQIERAKRKMEAEEDKNKKLFWKKYIEQLEDGRENLMIKKTQLRDLDASGDSETVAAMKESIDSLENSYYTMTQEQRAILYDYMQIEQDFITEGLVNSVKKTAKNVKKTVKDKQEAMDKWFDDTLKDIRNKTRNSAREDIVTDAFPKLSKMIRRATVLGAGFAIDPAIGAITVLVQYVLSKKSKESERKRLLSELKRELEIVEEKIRDADSSSDRKQKYELMRLKHKLQTDIDRIKKYI